MFAAHYELIKECGLIEPFTSIDDFIDKAIEEMKEIKEAKRQNDPNLPNEFMDLMCVCANFLQFLGYDLEDLLRNNIKVQVKRLNNGK
jgi:NTP pyrophosphatase (non-canonical NTP hydrolase)